MNLHSIFERTSLEFISSESTAQHRDITLLLDTKTSPCHSIQRHHLANSTVKDTPRFDKNTIFYLNETFFEIN